MRRASLALGILAHAPASIGLGFTILFMAMERSRGPAALWASQIDLLLFNIARFPHGFYVVAAIACVLIVPVRAAIDDVSPVAHGTGSSVVRAFATALLVPVAYLLVATVLDPLFRNEMTVYARMTAGTFMPIVLALWAMISVPITLAVSSMLKHRGVNC